MAVAGKSHAAIRGDGRTSVRPSVGLAPIGRPADGVVDLIEADAPTPDGVATGEPEGDMGLPPVDGDPFTGVEGDEDGPEAG